MFDLTDVNNRSIDYIRPQTSMRTVVAIIAFLLSCAGNVLAQHNDFAWLVGTWKLKDKPIIETWTVDADGKTLNGISMKVEGSQSTVLEETRIIFSGNSYYYIADVAGEQDPVDFGFTHHDSTSFVAENPKHDFPKVIRYTFVRREGKDYIEASVSGGDKSIPYVFERVR